MMDSEEGSDEDVLGHDSKSTQQASQCTFPTPKLVAPSTPNTRSTSTSTITTSSAETGTSTSTNTSVSTGISTSTSNTGTDSVGCAGNTSTMGTQTPVTTPACHPLLTPLSGLKKMESLDDGGTSSEDEDIDLMATIHPADLPHPLCPVVQPLDMRMPPAADISANQQLQSVLENQKLQLARTAYSQQREQDGSNSVPETTNECGGRNKLLDSKSGCESTEAAVETVSDLVDFVADHCESRADVEPRPRTHKASVTVADGVGSRCASLRLGPDRAVAGPAEWRKEAAIARLEVLVHAWVQDVCGSEANEEG